MTHATRVSSTASATTIGSLASPGCIECRLRFDAHPDSCAGKGHTHATFGLSSVHPHFEDYHASTAANVYDFLLHNEGPFLKRLRN